MSTLAAALLGGCAVNSTVERANDYAVDRMYARYAELATQALNRLAEASGAVPAESLEPPPLPEPVQMIPMVPAPVVQQAQPYLDPAIPAPLPPVVQQQQSAQYVVSSAGVDDVTAQQAAPVGPIIKAESTRRGLSRLLTIRPYTGDIEDFVYMIAADTGYIYLPHIGVKASPKVVTYSAKRKSAARVLKDLGAAVGNSATIVINEHERSLRVQYPIPTNYRSTDVSPPPRDTRTAVERALSRR